MNPYQILELILETLADGRKEGESIADYKLRKASELEKLYNDKEDKAGMVADNASKRANKEKGKFKKTKDLKNLENAMDLGSYALDKRMEASDASRKGTKASIIKYNTKRRNEMSEALEIAEAIINEVSLGKWKEAAKSSLPKRKENAEIADRATERAWDEYDKNARKYPEEEPHLYTLAVNNDEANIKAKRRAEHAEDVANIGSKDKASANKVVKAAKKVQDKREDAFGRNPSARTLKRSIEANKAAEADPVKSRTDEAFEIMEEILNVVESSKEDLVNKYVPNMKAERRHLDKEVKKGKKLTKGLEKSANFSGEMKEKAQQDYDKAQDKEWGAQYDVTRTEYGTPEHNVARVKYNKARQELKGADKELKDWTRDEYVTREKAGSIKKEAKEANKKRNDLNKKIAVLKGRSDVVTDKAFEALELMEQICDFADNLFELDYEQKQNIHPNKISRTKKDKNGEKVEVVSVADELFPYEGNAKEQFNKKVLDKINAMIEGSGSLEDLIQFVRAGVKGKAHESIDEGKEPNKECEYRKAKWEEASKKFDDTQAKHTDYAVEHPETKKAYDEERKAYADLEQARKDAKKISYPYHEALEILEGLFSKAKKDPFKSSPLARELRGKEATYNKHVDNEEKYTNRADGAKGYRAQVNRERAEDAGRAAVKAHKEYRKTKGEILQGLRDRGATNPQAHEIVRRMTETLELAEGLFKKDERGDLLDDIDTALGSPVKKKLADIKAKMTGCKETKVHEALDLMEEIINEVSKDFLGSKLEKGEEKRKEIEKEADEIIADPKKTEKDKKEATKKKAEYNCKAVNTTNRAFNYIEKKIDNHKK